MKFPKQCLSVSRPRFREGSLMKFPKTTPEIVLAPLTLVLETGPGGAGWKLLTFLCCAFAAWFFIFPSNLLIALLAWVLAWACAMALHMSLNRRRA
jgi:hypothetical protein